VAVNVTEPLLHFEVVTDVMVTGGSNTCLITVIGLLAEVIGLAQDYYLS
jgi:hypothetical protein